MVESQDVRADPRGVLSALCAACGIPFDSAMLSWAHGRRAIDGVWAPVWYQAVELSIGFAAPRRELAFDALPEVLKLIAAAARPIYDRLAAHKLTAAPLDS